LEDRLAEAVGIDAIGLRDLAFGWEGGELEPGRLTLGDQGGVHGLGVVAVDEAVHHLGGGEADLAKCLSGCCL
jgi:hypothetical protein